MTRPASITPAAGAELLDGLTAAVSRAGAAILATDHTSAPKRKADASPVTAADLAAEKIILEVLTGMLPGIPIVSEESPQATSSLAETSFALVDPLDGTVEFIAGRKEFTVNVAIVSNGSPVVGVVGAPALGLIWRGIVGLHAERLTLAPGQGPTAATERTTIRTRPRPAEGLVATISRSHLDPATRDFLSRLAPSRQLVCGSAVKFCRLAEGGADIYPRLAPTSEWDVAAGQAILTAAGGGVTTPQGAPLAYGRAAEGFRIPAFIAWGDMRELPLPQ